MAQKRDGGAAKKKPLCETLSPSEKTRLFDMYVKPRMRDVYTLAMRYTNKYQDVQSNYNLCLSQLWNYIGSYDPNKSIETWVHIVVKRACFNQNKRQVAEASHYTDVEMVSVYDLHQHGTSNIVDAAFRGHRRECQRACLQGADGDSSEAFVSFLALRSGIWDKEIALMEYKAGHIECKSEDKIKSRIYWTRSQLRFILKKYGVTRQNRTGEQDD